MFVTWTQRETNANHHNKYYHKHKEGKPNPTEEESMLALKRHAKSSSGSKIGEVLNEIFNREIT